MTKDIAVIREAITKVVGLLTNQAITVTQRGAKAFVSYRPNGSIASVNLPYIPDDASEEFIAAVQGFLDHEVGHVLYTDPKIVHKAAALGARVKNLANALEDVYIERRMTEAFRGSVGNLESVRRFHIEKMADPKIKAALAAGDTATAAGYAGLIQFRAWGGQQTAKDYLTANPAIAALNDEMAKRIGPELIAKIASISSSKESLNLAKAIKAKLDPVEPKKPEAPTKPKDGGDKGDGEKDKSEKGEGEKGEGKGERDKTKSETDDSGKKRDEVSKTDETGEAGGDVEGDEPADDAEESDEPKPEPSDKPEPGEDPDAGGEPTEEPEPEPEAEPDDTERGSGDGEPDEGEPDRGERDGESDEDLDDESDDSLGDESGDGEGEGEEDGEGEEGGGGDASGEEGEGAADEGGDKSSTTGSHLDESSDVAEVGGEPDLGGTFEVDRDFDKEASEALTTAATSELRSSDYRVFSTDWDKVVPAQKSHNPAAVTAMADKTQHMIAGIQKTLERAMAAKDRKTWNPGLRRGRIAPGALFKTSVGDDRVFRQRYETRAKSTAVSLLVDCSGSMAYDDRIGKAGLAAYALSSTLERLKIAHEVIGFTTTAPRALKAAMEAEGLGLRYARNEALYMPVFKSFGERLNVDAKARIAALTEYPGWLSQNVDGECVQIAARRLKTQRAERHILIVLSDGSPACPGDGFAQEKHLRKVVKDLEEKGGVEVVGIGIETDTVRHFYSKSLTLNDIRELPTTVVGQLTKLLLAP